MRPWKAAAALLVLVGTAGAKTYSEAVNVEFTLGQGETVRLENPNGTVTLTAATGRELRVEALKKADASKKEDAEGLLEEIKVAARHESGGVVIRTTGPDGSKAPLGRWGWKIPSWSVDYRVKVPTHCPVSVSLASGDVNAEGLVGSFDAVSTSGEIRVEDLQGDVQLASTSGDIEAYDVEGQLDIRATSGSIEASGITDELLVENVSGEIAVSNLGAGVGIETVSGEVRLDLSTSDCPDAGVESISGGVRVVLSQDASADVSLGTVTGEIRYGRLPLQRRREGKESVEGTIGNGCGSVKVATVSGSITLSQ